MLHVSANGETLFVNIISPRIFPRLKSLMQSIFFLSLCRLQGSQLINYSVTSSTGATQRFSTNHKRSSEQKNQSSFISDQSQMRALRRKVYFHRRKGN